MPKDLLTIKKHRFFNKIDWKKLAKRELEAPIQPLITDPELAENFATEFTELPLSPVVTFKKPWEIDSSLPTDNKDGSKAEDDPFGGFSYVASSSLLETHAFGAFGEPLST